MLTEPLGCDYRISSSSSPVNTAKRLLYFKQTFHKAFPCAPAGPRAGGKGGAGGKFPLFKGPYYEDVLRTFP
jgi:hypothetical protein